MIGEESGVTLRGYKRVKIRVCNVFLTPQRVL